MGATITETLMTSTDTRHTARWSADAAADGHGAWIVSWLPQRLLTRNQAITAMTLAEAVADLSGNWPLIEDWAAELHVDPQRAVKLLTSSL